MVPVARVSGCLGASLPQAARSEEASAAKKMFPKRDMPAILAFICIKYDAIAVVVTII
jgi:hypothetical protein